MGSLFASVWRGGAVASVMKGLVSHTNLNRLVFNQFLFKSVFGGHSEHGTESSERGGAGSFFEPPY